MIHRMRVAAADDLATRSARREQSIRDQADDLIAFVEANSPMPIDPRTAFEAVTSITSNRISIAIADLQYAAAELIRPTHEGSLHDDPRG